MYGCRKMAQMFHKDQCNSSFGSGIHICKEKWVTQLAKSDVLFLTHITFYGVQ